MGREAGVGIEALKPISAQIQFQKLWYTRGQDGTLFTLSYIEMQILLSKNFLSQSEVLQTLQSGIPPTEQAPDLH